VVQQEGLSAATGFYPGPATQLGMGCVDAAEKAQHRISRMLWEEDGDPASV